MTLEQRILANRRLVGFGMPAMTWSGVLMIPLASVWPIFEKIDTLVFVAAGAVAMWPLQPLARHSLELSRSLAQRDGQELRLGGGARWLFGLCDTDNAFVVAALTTPLLSGLVALVLTGILPLQPGWAAPPIGRAVLAQLIGFACGLAWMTFVAVRLRRR